MSEAHTVSPLLDEFTLGEPFSSHHGITCCPAIHAVTKEKFILKNISVPESQIQVDAMLLTGACETKEAAGAYFADSAQELVQEMDALQALSKGRGFVPFFAHQLTEKSDGEIGVNLLVLAPYRTTLAAYAKHNPMTHLAAVNLGIDLCAALALARQAGYIYLDLKPENIMVTSQRQFQIGDLGLLSADMLDYATFPDKYRSAFTAPELFDDLAPLNTTVDIYSLGMILHGIFNCGKPSFSEEQRLGGEAVPAPVAADPEMAQIIAKAVAFRPEDRWQSPEQMGSALVAYLQRNTVNDSVLVPPPVPETPAEPEPQAAEPAAEVLPEEPAFAQVPEEPIAEEPAAEVFASQEAPVTEESEALPLETEVFEETAAPEEMPAAEEEAEPQEVPEAEPEAPPAPEVPPMDPQELEDILSRADTFLAAPEAPKKVITRSAPEEKEAEPEPEEKPEKKRSLRKLYVSLIALVLLGGLILGGLVYYSQFYLVSVKSLEVIDTSLNSLTVAVSTKSSELYLTCQDTYGNSYSASPVDGIVTFADLNPGTQYTITAVVDGFHKLTGTTQVSGATALQTEIVDFGSMIGAEDGSAVLYFTVNGAEPSEWTLRYSTEGEDERSRVFTGHTVSVSGLSVGKEYSFRLEASDDIFVTGEYTMSMTASSVILAQNLRVTEFGKNSLTVVWDAPETPVESWDVRCYSGDQYNIAVTVTDCTATIEGVDLSLANTVDVTAAGMTQNTWISMTENPACLSGCTVDPSTPGEMTVSWTYTGADPRQWIFLYAFNDTATGIEPIVTDQTSAVVSPLLPATNYLFTIQAASGSSVYNNVFAASLPQAADFRSYGVTDLSIATYPVPQQPEPEEGQEPEEEWHWGVAEILPENAKSAFTPDETLVFVITAEGRLQEAEDEVTTLMVIRNADGVPVDYMVGTLAWDTMWYNNQYLCEILTLPQDAGAYTLDVYLNGLLAASAPFQIQ